MRHEPNPAAEACYDVGRIDGLSVSNERAGSREITRIARLATPIALAQFGFTAIGLVDVAVLGHASAIDLAGASIGRSINFATTALAIGVSAALEPLAAQAIGAGEHEAAWRAYLAGLVACVVVWVPSSVLAWCVTYLLEPLGIARELVLPAQSFLLAQLPGMLGLGVYLTAKSYVQANGATRSPLTAAILANLVNLVVCNVLVRGDEALVAVGLPAFGLLPQGAFGAGLASTIAHGVLGGWVLLAAYRARPVGGGRSPLPIGKVIRIGGPIGLQLLAEIGVFSFAALLAGRLGQTAVGAHQIAIGLASFTFMGALGISGATAVTVGHAVGEGRPPRSAGVAGMALGAMYMSVTAILFLLCRGALARLFTDDGAVAALTAELLIVAAAFQLFDGVQVVAGGALRGAGDVKFAFYVNVAAHWLVGLPLALWLAFRAGYGARGIWFGLLAGLAIVALLLAWRFVRITRRAIARV